MMNRAATDDLPLVRVQGLCKEYRQGDLRVRALDDINLEFRQGEFTALVGPSGSGKTTLLNLIGALDTPSTGNIVLGDDALAGLTRAQLADLRLKKIGFIFQDYNLLPVLSALENVEYVLLLQRVPSAERRRRADAALRQVGLDGCQHRRPSQLSGGQQQRVAIARAIAAEPLLVLADEPTANLDSDTGAALIDTMLALNRSKGITFLFSTHDAMIMRHAKRVVRLKDGAVVEDGVHAIC
jgi:putative ABC transport system ATP-binding protein